MESPVQSECNVILKNPYFIGRKTKKSEFNLFSDLRFFFKKFILFFYGSHFLSHPKNHKLLTFTKKIRING
jgi:hypothetical protein